MIKRFYLAIAIGVLVCSATLAVSQADEDNDRARYEALYHDLEEIITHIRNSTESIKLGKTTHLSQERIFSKTVLPEFYRNREYRPAWSNFDALQDAVTALRGSRQDGLILNDYHVEELNSIITQLKAQESSGKIDYQMVAMFDILLTDGILLYAYHLLEGKIDPLTLDPDWNYENAKIPGDAAESLSYAIKNNMVTEELHLLRPQYPVYKLFIAELEKYRAIADDGGWGTVEPGGKIESGDDDPRIAGIRMRLSVTGDLSDTLNTESTIYDALLEKDIRSFQARHGLDADGVVGKASFIALNIPVEKKIDMIRVNMERTRWIMHDLLENFIIVNIAGFELFVYEDEKRAWETRVVVGKHYHETPVFKSKMKYIEFNCTWTLPRSIIIKETIPKMKKDHDYLGKHHMVLLDHSGNIVPSSVLDYDNLSADYFPYSIRQEPGPWNALGQIKFIFPNNHSVYIHDTPSKSLFDKSERAYSHGCVRVENPLDLAVELLKGTEYTREKIEAILRSQKTTRIFFDDPLDVLLFYWTSGLYGDGRIFFVQDVYQRDQEVLENLNRKDKTVGTRELRGY